MEIREYDSTELYDHRCYGIIVNGDKTNPAGVETDIKLLDSNYTKLYEIFYDLFRDIAEEYDESYILFDQKTGKFHIQLAKDEWVVIDVEDPFEVHYTLVKDSIRQNHNSLKDAVSDAMEFLITSKIPENED